MWCKENDLIGVLWNDIDTKVILMYVEDLANGRKFIEIVSKMTGGFSNKITERLRGKTNTCHSR